jgi:hypothetical protein
MFFHLFEEPQARSWSDCSFDRMFSALKLSSMSKFADTVSQKFLCLFHYFDQMREQLTAIPPIERWVSFERKHLPEPLKPSGLSGTNNISLCQFEIAPDGQGLTLLFE